LAKTTARIQRRRPVRLARIAKRFGPRRLSLKPFISNPDLVIRLFLDAPVMPANREMFYGGTKQGYTDYPTLRVVEPHACYEHVETAWG